MTDLSITARTGWDYISACHQGRLPLSARNLEIVRRWRLAGHELGRAGPGWSELQNMLDEVAARGRGDDS